MFEKCFGRSVDTLPDNVSWVNSWFFCLIVADKQTLMHTDLLLQAYPYCFTKGQWESRTEVKKTFELDGKHT